MTHYASTVQRKPPVIFVCVLTWIACVTSACRTAGPADLGTIPPISVGILLAKVTPSGAGPLCSPLEWQALVSKHLATMCDGIRVLAYDPTIEDAAYKNSFDIVIQPVVQRPEMGTIANNSGAIPANLAWLATYFGYFAFADMSVPCKASLEFQVFQRVDGQILESRKVATPARIDLRFDERDELFSPRFFMTLLLFPALHPFVCRLVGIDPADREEVVRAVQDCLAVEAARGIATFLTEALPDSLNQHKLPFVDATRMQLATNSSGSILTVSIHASGTRLPSPRVYARLQNGKYPRKDELVPVTRIDQYTVNGIVVGTYECRLTMPLEDVILVRLFLEEDAPVPRPNQTTTFTILGSRLRDLPAIGIVRQR